MAARPKAPNRPTKRRGLWYAENGEIVAHGETYTNKQSCEHGIQVVKRIAPGAQVLDLSQSAQR
jgi:uncharacterized protein YegP (UPF0339 family)